MPPTATMNQSSITVGGFFLPGVAGRSAGIEYMRRKPASAVGVSGKTLSKAKVKAEPLKWRSTAPYGR
jgi:hypothetical protein